MATYVELKFHFQKLSEIEIFRKSKNFRMILISIIRMRPWCYIWCWKQHSIIVASFQQKCCFSALNIDFSWLFTLVHVKIGNQTKNNICCRKTTILLKMGNNDLLLLHLSIIAPRSSKTLSDDLLDFFTHVLEGFLGNLLKKLKNEFL